MFKEYKSKLFLLIALTVASFVAILFFDPIFQDSKYHLFADRRTIWAIPNFSNVITNIVFIVVGVLGQFIVFRSSAPRPFKLIYFILFSGIVLTGFGSAYYHLWPDNNSLVYDRIPMSIVFMSFLCAIISQHIKKEVGELLIIPLILLGITSVIWWNHTESVGSGDLRFYGLIQFYPVIFIPVILLLFPVSEYKYQNKLFAWIVGWYVIAKIFERFDSEIYQITSIISGHSLKHLAAAMSTWYILKTFTRKYSFTGTAK